MLSHEYRLFCYNQSRYVEDFLNRNLENEILPNITSIYDDCSEDDTEELVSSFIPRYKRRGASIRLYKSDVNRGIYANYNRGISSAKCDYTHFCSGDDYFAFGHLQQLNSEILRLDLPTNHKIILFSNFYNDVRGNIRPVKNIITDDPVYQILSGKFTFRCQGLSRSILNNAGQFRAQLGIWADLFWEIETVLGASQLVFCDAPSHVYRSKIGTSSKTPIKEVLDSQNKVLMKIVEELEISTKHREKIEYLTARNQMLLSFDASNAYAFFMKFAKSYGKHASVRDAIEIIKSITK